MNNEIDSAFSKWAGDEAAHASAIGCNLTASAFEAGYRAALTKREVIPALQRYNECRDSQLDTEQALERLRFFLSLALSPQDWIDVEPFLDAVRDEAKREAVAVPEGVREVRYLTDDRDLEEPHELMIRFGGNGDWYVSVLPKGHRIGPAVRLCTSGGASRAAPGLCGAIADAFAILAASQQPAQKEGE